MSVDLVDYVPSLKRAVRPPGSDLYEAVTDAEWVGHLSDAFWQARLDGFLEGYVVDTQDPDDPVDNAVDTSPPGGEDITDTDMALVILYAAIKVLTQQILNMKAGFRAKAGTVEYEETAVGATVLAEMLKQLRATKDRIMEELDGDETSVTVLDTFSSRIFSMDGGYYPSLGMSG